MIRYFCSLQHPRLAANINLVLILKCGLKMQQQFNSLYQEYGYDFDAYALTNSDVWQQLMLDMVITI